MLTEHDLTALHQLSKPECLYARIADGYVGVYSAVAILVDHLRQCQRRNTLLEHELEQRQAERIKELEGR